MKQRPIARSFHVKQSIHFLCIFTYFIHILCIFYRILCILLYALYIILICKMNNRFCSLKNFIDFLPFCSLKKLWKMFNKLTNIHIFNKNTYFLIKLLILFVFFNNFLYLYTFFAYFCIFVSQYYKILQIVVILLILMQFYAILGYFKHFAQPIVYIRYVVWYSFIIFSIRRVNILIFV